MCERFFHSFILILHSRVKTYLQLQSKKYLEKNSLFEEKTFSKITFLKRNSSKKNLLKKIFFSNNFFQRVSFFEIFFRISRGLVEIWTSSQGTIPLQTLIHRYFVRKDGRTKSGVLYCFYRHSKITTHYNILLLLVKVVNKFNTVISYFANDHTMLNTPVLVRSLKLSNIGPS